MRRVPVVARPAEDLIGWEGLGWAGFGSLLNKLISYDIGSLMSHSLFPPECINWRKIEWYGIFWEQNRE